MFIIVSCEHKIDKKLGTMIITNKSKLAQISNIESESNKSIAVAIFLFLLVPVSYGLTYIFRLGEAAFYRIPFHLVTVSLTDFFRYLIPYLILLLFIIELCVLAVTFIQRTMGRSPKCFPYKGLLFVCGTIAFCLTMFETTYIVYYLQEITGTYFHWYALILIAVSAILLYFSKRLLLSNTYKKFRFS